jgi:solute carrier family 32 (vesicular inhibitory amino acid transporter)
MVLYDLQLFNSTAILLGIGMLSEPLAFAYAGWVMGTVLIIFYGFITCYTCVAVTLPAYCLQSLLLQSQDPCAYNRSRSNPQNVCGHRTESLWSTVDCVYWYSILSRSLCRKGCPLCTVWSHLCYLHTYSVVLVTLYGDSMHLVMPGFSSNQYKFLGLLMQVQIPSFISYILQ